MLTFHKKYGKNKPSFNLGQTEDGMGRSKTRKNKQEPTFGEITFPGLEQLYALDSGKRRIKDCDPGKFALLRYSGKGTKIKYPCEHSAYRYMAYRCPSFLLAVCKEYVNAQARFTELQNFILFDPRGEVAERVPKITHLCPECYFGPIVRKHPACCFCGRPILPGDIVYLYPFGEKNANKLGFMCVKVDDGKQKTKWLVRCTHGQCGRVRERALLAWDGEKLMSFRDYTEQVKRDRRAA